MKTRRWRHGQLPVERKAPRRFRAATAGQSRLSLPYASRSAGDARRTHSQMCCWKRCARRLSASTASSTEGDSYLFSEENLQSAIQRLKGVGTTACSKPIRSVYDLLTLGVALEQSVEGTQCAVPLATSTGKIRRTTSYHVTAEFSVERTHSRDGAAGHCAVRQQHPVRGDQINQAPNTEVAQAVSQMIRNQRDEYIPALFTYAQLVIGSNKNHCKYATVGTAGRVLGGVARRGGKRRTRMARPCVRCWINLCRWKQKLDCMSCWPRGLAYVGERRISGASCADRTGSHAFRARYASPNVCCAWHWLLRYSMAADAKLPATGSSSRSGAHRRAG